MIDEFCIFERGGTVLWRRNFVALKGDPLAILVRSVLLEDRLSLPELSFDCYTLRWLLDNDRGLVYVVIFQRLLPPAYANDLLHMVRKHFTKHHVRTRPAQAGALIVDCDRDFDLFSDPFESILHAAERKSMDMAKATRIAPAPSRRRNDSERALGPESDATASLPDRDTDPDSEQSMKPLLSANEVVKRNRADFIRRKAAARHSSKSKSRTAPGDAMVAPEPMSRGKVMRPSKKSANEDISALDFSVGGVSDAAAAEGEVARVRKQFMEAEPNSGYDVIEDSSEEEEGEGQSEKEGAVGGVFNYFKGLAGMRNLTRADLMPAMDEFRDALIGKNVAQDIANRLIESVLTSLEGKRMESMTSVTTTVRNALDEALTRILTARQSTDILADIAAKKGTGRPYVITYCGVNGVGKSTSLAKTCYYLLNHGYKVMIAACDTFRAGAVEQLRTHVKCLGRGVELFDRGYGKDAAAVANDAIRKAKELGYDVVLVDTAGRMQDNEPLMRALSKLVEVNRPDRLFFVGEALVGNDAVDQLTKFNAALTDHQSSSQPRLIDGIVLTKFDTIDDKVGAAVSMVYTTGQPIVFVGVGQTYMDLRKINTRSLVKALLK